MTKDELLQKINEGIRTEESATSVYLAHLDAIVERSSLEPEKIEKLRQGIGHLVAENKKHKAILENLLFRVQTGDVDVY